MKYGLFATEKIRTEYTTIGHYLSESCFEYLCSFDSVEEAKEAQKNYSINTIIIPHY